MVTDVDRAQRLADLINRRMREIGIDGDREFARRGGFAHGNLYQIRSGKVPGLKVLLGIAKGLELPLVTILQEMGFEEPIAETPILRELMFLFNQLSNEDQERALALVRALREEQKRRKQRETTS